MLLQYINVRTRVVELVARVAGMIGLEHETVHASMSYMDRYRARIVEQGPDRLVVAAVSCLMIATKNHERLTDDEGFLWLPPCRDFLEAMRQAVEDGPQLHFTVNHLVAYEVRVCQELDWELSSATPYSFAVAFRTKGLVGDEDAVQGLPLLPEETRQVWRLTKFFVDLATQRALGLLHGMAVSACAAIALSRTLCNLDIVWPDALAARLGRTLPQISPCALEILDVYRQNFADHALNYPSAVTADQRFTFPNEDAQKEEAQQPDHLISPPATRLAVSDDPACSAAKTAANGRMRGQGKRGAADGGGGAAKRRLSEGLP